MVLFYATGRPLWGFFLHINYNSKSLFFYLTICSLQYMYFFNGRIGSYTYLHPLVSTRNILRNQVEDFSWLSEKYLRKYRLYDMKCAVLLIPYFVWELNAENNSSQLLKNLRYLCCSLPWMWSVGREGTLQPQVVPAAPTSSVIEQQHIKQMQN